MSGEVFLPARTLRQAAKRIGTPFYVYDEAGLRQNAAVARAAFSWNAGFALWFPLRWNPNPAVLSILRESGCGVECTSAAELAHAERCGFSSLNNFRRIFGRTYGMTPRQFRQSSSV